MLHMQPNKYLGSSNQDFISYTGNSHRVYHGTTTVAESILAVHESFHEHYSDKTRRKNLAKLPGYCACLCKSKPETPHHWRNQNAQ